MATRSLANISPLLKSLAISTNCLFLQQSLVEETFREFLANDFKESMERTDTLHVICSVSDTLRDSMKGNERLLNLLKSV